MFSAIESRFQSIMLYSRVAYDQQHDSSVFRQWHVYMHSTYPQMYHYALIHNSLYIHWVLWVVTLPSNSDQLGHHHDHQLLLLHQPDQSAMDADQPGHWKRWWQRGCQRGAVGTFLWSLKWWIVFLHVQTPNPPKNISNQRNVDEYRIVS